MSELRKFVRQVLKDLGGVVLPAECVGCGAWDETVCDKCLVQLLGEPKMWELEFPQPDRRNLPVFEVAPYVGAMRRMVISAKHDSRLELRPYFQVAGENLLRGISAQDEYRKVFDSLADSLAAAQCREREVFVVPAPSTRARRSSPVVEAFAAGVMNGLVDSHLATQSSVLEVLEFHAGVTSQSGLNGSKRVGNRHGKMRLIECLSLAQQSRGLAGVKVVLVDDVCATGSTLNEMVRVLSAVGADVLAAFVFSSSRFV